MGSHDEQDDIKKIIQLLWPYFGAFVVLVFLKQFTRHVNNEEKLCMAIVTFLDGLCCYHFFREIVLPFWFHVVHEFLFEKGNDNAAKTHKFVMFILFLGSLKLNQMHIDGLAVAKMYLVCFFALASFMFAMKWV